MATSSARPALASQAEKVRRSIGEAEKLTELSWRVHMERAIKSESIIPSKHKRAERRWVRWNARPARPRRKVEEKAKCVGVIRRLWTLTISS